ncbi:oxalate decarboxylase protein [Salinisphaera shabanensis E1L3A]|uniref:Oxalate decarboxylase protein n=1 Tax=Salinisphaera shabanensis E1L3A TaxID=1033802 RepID=U2FZW1_9GAMM|nr:cupin domain-containing protein [Salinisphaera shabanensis]ERJ19618.1 oxalate decarboxylase protein [Salinisphaera shabanensis E1L3A]
MNPIARSLDDFETYRIEADATNRLAIIHDPKRDGTNFIVCIEIFDVDGRQPPNLHEHGDEWFYVLHGEGTCTVDGNPCALKKGDAVLIPSGGEHFIQNTGSERLYMMCLMVPDDAFGDLIRSGVPAELDDEDRRVLSGLVHAA